MYEPEQVADYYRYFFPARNDVYSRWTSSGWRPLREELTPQIVVAGLTGAGPSISGYMINVGSTSHSLAVDFDTDNGFDQGMALARTMTANGMPAYVETSRRGSHLWAVFDAVMPAVVIRFGLHALLAASGLPTDNPKIELRPGSDRVSDDGLGHALRLPFMPHPKTGERGVLYSTKGVMPNRLSETLLAWDYASASAMHDWSEKWHPPVDRIPDQYRQPHAPYPEDLSTASEILASDWGVLNARPGRSVRCPAHDDHVASLNIFPDDKRAMCMAGGCILNNNDHGRGTWELRKLAHDRRA